MLHKKRYNKISTMNKEVLEFVNQIKSNTGLDLNVYGENGKSVNSGADLTPLPPFSEGFCVGYNGNTYFRFSYNRVNYISFIEGDGPTEKSLASVIVQLAKSLTKEEITKQGFINLLFSGEAESSLIKKNAKKFGLYDKPLFASVVKLEKGDKKDVIDFIDSYAQLGDFYSDFDEDKVVFVKVCDDSIGDYSSCAQYAEFLVRSVYEETGACIKIGVGGIADGLEKLNVSYKQALSTMDMMDVLQATGNVHTYKEYVLIQILTDLPKNKMNSYLALLNDAGTKELFEDAEILQTAEIFLENNLNASETSRKMYLHRNTLTYRLDKIEKATGLNIRKFADAVTFRLMTILARLTR